VIISQRGFFNFAYIYFLEHAYLFCLFLSLSHLVQLIRNTLKMSSFSGKGKVVLYIQVSTKIHYNFLVFLMFIYDTPCVWKTRRWCFFLVLRQNRPLILSFSSTNILVQYIFGKKEEAGVNSLSQDSSVSIKTYF
jgi:hypothetical protein